MNHVLVNNEKVSPSKVVCVGRNYVEHIKELNNEMPSSMVIFGKPNSAISASLKAFSQPLHYEGEITLLIRNKKIYAAGIGLDLTDRAIQSELKGKGLPWERAKAFDGAAVLSPFVSINESDIKLLSLELWINDVLVQKGGVELMIHKPNAIVEEITSFMSLEDNDVIMTGTPKGVGSYIRGDVFVGKIFIDDKEVLTQEWIAQ